MQVVRKKLADLKKYDKNVRRHSKKQIEEYVRSVKKFGQIRPMVVDDQNVILAGNGLYEALLQMGHDEADVYVVKGLSEKDKVKLMMADNKVYELGSTDMDAIEDIVAFLDKDFDIPGYDDELLNLLSASLSDIDNEIKSYGNYSEVTTQKYNEEDEKKKQYGEVGVVGAYAPVERNEDTGEIINKNEIQAAHENQSTVETMRFVICPKCGEKIWL